MKPKKTKSSCLQILSPNKKAYSAIACFILLNLLSFFWVENLSSQVIRKSQVFFKSADGLLVTADLYKSLNSNPYVILFHQEQSSRGEFDSIASRFIKMNYNCMSVDLRSGDKFGFVKNETAIRAKQEGFSMKLRKASLDMEAAIDFLSQFSDQKVTLFGSASSASLALIVGLNNENVNSVVALSPGEYFSPEFELKKVLSNYPKPVFVACTEEEYPYFSDIEGFTGSDKTLFKPTISKGQRGTNALKRENPARDEYWLSLLIFFKSLR